MSPAEDRFIAGEGPLAALVRAQPAFEPPPQMLERVLAALDATPAPAGFEPPAALFDAVMAEADRLDAAQAPRREALLAELAAGKAAVDALGTPISPATAEWLARQRPASAPARPRRRWPWLAGLGTALTAALAVSVALRVVQESATPPEMAALPATAPAESATDTLRGAAAGEPAEVSASAARSADNAIPLAAKPQLTERLAKAEAPAAGPARSREMPRPEADAKRAAPAPVRDEPAPAAPTAAPPMMAKALRAPAPGARPAAEADTAIATNDIIDAPLDTPAATLAARLLARPAQAWTLHVAPADAAAGRALQADLLAQLQAAGREDPITLAEHPLPRGQLRLSPTR